MIISIKQRKEKREPQQIHDCIQLGKLYVHSPNGLYVYEKFKSLVRNFMVYHFKALHS